MLDGSFAPAPPSARIPSGVAPVVASVVSAILGSGPCDMFAAKEMNRKFLLLIAGFTKFFPIPPLELFNNYNGNEATDYSHPQREVCRYVVRDQKTGNSRTQVAYRLWLLCKIIVEPFKTDTGDDAYCAEQDYSCSEHIYSRNKGPVPVQAERIPSVRRIRIRNDMRRIGHDQVRVKFLFFHYLLVASFTIPFASVFTKLRGLLAGQM